MSRLDRGKLLGAVLALGLLGTVASGCGSDDGGSDTGTTSGTAAAADAPTGEPIKIMVVTSENSEFYNNPELWNIAEAYAGTVNADGGVNGRPIEIVRCNDQADLNRAQRCARQAESEGVVALVGGVTVHGDKMFPVLDQSQIPWVGHNPLNPASWTSEMSYATTPTPFMYAAVGNRMQEECETPNIVVLDEPTNQGLLDTFVTFGLKASDPAAEAAKVVNVPFDATDYTPFVAQATENDPDCLYVQLTLDRAQRFAPVLERSGKSPTYYANGTGFDRQAVIDSAPMAVDGAVIAAGFPLSSSPIWDEAKSAIEEYGDISVEEAALNGINQAGTWIAMAAFTDVAKTIEGDVTSESLLKALDTAKNVDTGGITEPLDFTTPYPVEGFPRLFNQSVWFWTVEDANFAEMSDAPVDMSQVFADGVENTG